MTRQAFFFACYHSGLVFLADAVYCLFAGVILPERGQSQRIVATFAALLSVLIRQSGLLLPAAVCVPVRIAISVYRTDDRFSSPVSVFSAVQSVNRFSAELACLMSDCPFPGLQSLSLFFIVKNPLMQMIRLQSPFFTLRILHHLLHRFRFSL